MPAFREREIRPVVTYPRDAVLEPRHLAHAFGVSEEMVASMDLPCFMIGNRTRFLWGQVVDELARRADPDAAAALDHGAATRPARASERRRA